VPQGWLDYNNSSIHFFDFGQKNEFCINNLILKSMMTILTEFNGVEHECAEYQNHLLYLTNLSKKIEEIKRYPIFRDILAAAA
jgi:hypothetical protein